MEKKNIIPILITISISIIIIYLLVRFIGFVANNIWYILGITLLIVGGIFLYNKLNQNNQ